MIEASDKDVDRAATLLSIALGDRRIHQRPQFSPHRIGRRRQQLRHEDRDQIFGRIDPERCGCRTTPGILTGAAGNQGLRRPQRHRKSKTESDSVVCRLAEQRARQLRQGLASRQVVGGHQLDRLRRQQANITEPTSVQQLSLIHI